MNWNVFHLRSLNTKVTLFTLTIFVISIWSLTFYASRILRDDMQHLLGEQQFSIVTLIATDVNEELGDRLRALEQLAEVVAPEIKGDRRALQTILQQHRHLQDMFSGGVTAIGVDGTTIADIPLSAQRIGVNYMDRDIVVAALREGKSTIGRPVVGRKLHSPIVAMAAPVRDKQGKVIGAVTGVIDLGRPNFLDKIAQGRYGKSGSFLLAAPQYNLIVTSSDKTRIMRSLPAPGISSLHDQYAHGFEGYGVLVNFRGEEELTAAKGIPVAGWYIGVALPTSEAFAPIRDMQHRILLGASFLTLLAGGLTWWMIRRQLSPMLATMNTLAALSDINQPPPPLPIVRQDEIGDFIAGFNRLLETLSKRDVALRASESQLSFLVSASPVTIYTCEPTPPYGATYISPNVTRNIGYKPEQFTENSGFWAENIHLDDKQRIFDGLPQLFENGTHAHEYRFRVADGSYRWMHDELRLVRDETGKVTEIIGYWADVSRRKLAESLLTQSAADVKVAYRKLAEAQEQERRALARELHDQVGQNLTALNLNLNRLNGELASSLTSAPRERVSDSLALVEDTAQRIRDVMSNLRPPMLDDYGLFATLRWWVYESATRSGISIELTGAEAKPRLPIKQESTLFRVAQEALLNAIKHSGAKRISVTFEAVPGGVRLAISDDGRGLPDAAGIETAGPTWGILSMRERAESIGGSLRVESAGPGTGTRIVVEVVRAES